MTPTQMSFQPSLEVPLLPRYRREFPDFGSMDVGVPVDLIDASSWLDDECPSFEMPAQDPDEPPLVTLFIDYKNPAQRLLSKPWQRNARFSAYVGAETVEPALVTDSWAEVVRFLDLRRPFAGFEHNGMHITNPTCCDSGARFVVSPSQYDFNVEDTGGGCTAWVRRFVQGGHLILTDLGGTSHHLGESMATFLIGVYDAEGSEVSMHHAVVGVLSNANANFGGESAVPPDVKYAPLALVPGMRNLHAVRLELPVADVDALGLHIPGSTEISSQAVAKASSEALLVIDALRKSLAQSLNFIEHKLANEGKAVTSEQWDDNVRALRAGPAGQIGIGQSYIDKASVDLAQTRCALAAAKSFLSKHQAVSCL